MMCAHVWALQACLLIIALASHIVPGPRFLVFFRPANKRRSTSSVKKRCDSRSTLCGQEGRTGSGTNNNKPLPVVRPLPCLRLPVCSVATGEAQHGRSQRLRNRLVLCISWFKVAIASFDEAVATQIGYLKTFPFFCLKFISHFKPSACGICLCSMSKAVLPSLRTQNTGVRGFRPLAPCTLSNFSSEKGQPTKKYSRFLD